MPAHKHCELFLPTVFTQRVSLKLGLQRSRTVSWVLRDSSDAPHPLSPVIKVGIRRPRKKARNILA